MTPKNWLFAVALAPALATTSAAAEIPDGSHISFHDLSFTPLDETTKVTLTKSMGKSVTVVGGHTAVKLSPTGDAKAKDSLSFGIRHVDTGKQSFDLVFHTEGGDSVVSYTDDACADVDSSSKTEIKKATHVAVDEQGNVISGECKPGSAALTAKFVGAASWSLEVTRKGKVLQALDGVKGSAFMGNFEGKAELQNAENLKVKLVYGAERADAWTIVLRYEGHVVSITPDAAQPFAGLPAVSLRTNGLDEVELVNVKAG